MYSAGISSDPLALFPLSLRAARVISACVGGSQQISRRSIIRSRCGTTGVDRSAHCTLDKCSAKASALCTVSTNFSLRSRRRPCGGRLGFSATRKLFQLPSAMVLSIHCFLSSLQLLRTSFSSWRWDSKSPFLRASFFRSSNCNVALLTH